MEFIQRNIGLFGRTAGGISRAQATVFRGLLDQLATGEYEEVEARAQALAARPRRVWDRSPEPVWMARTFALTAAVLYGRWEHVLPELEALTAALRQTSGSVRTLLLVVRINRAVVLLDQERYSESEAAGVLREVTRLAHLTRVADIELSALACLAEALCGQGRFEEAEAVARGNLPRDREQSRVLAVSPGAQPERAGPLRGGARRVPTADAARVPSRERAVGHGRRRGSARSGPPRRGRDDGSSGGGRV
ncbi:hypothetical protein [Streptomyces sp. NPDC059489]|uniref:hypothetical protein n=1 Tax=Streptomyces sp. NPDC059489 TaxID=3346849 RepID=UPI0036BA3A4F